MPQGVIPFVKSVHENEKRQFQSGKRSEWVGGWRMVGTAIQGFQGTGTANSHVR